MGDEKDAFYVVRKGDNVGVYKSVNDLQSVLQSCEGWTPLHVAMQTRNRDIAKILLVNGADTTRRNKDGNTALELSICYGKDFKSYDLAKLLKQVSASRGL